MRTIGEIRRNNLELLIAEAGTLEAVAERGETHQVYLSQIRNRAIDTKSGRPRELDTKVARRLEAAFDKDQGWMDEPHYTAATNATRLSTRPQQALGALSPREVDAVLALRAVSQKIRERVVNELMQAAEDANHFAAEVLAREGARTNVKTGESLPIRPDGPQLDSLPGELDEK